MKEKKSNQRIVLQRGRNGEKREDRQLERERDLGEEEKPEFVSVRV